MNLNATPETVQNVAAAFQLAGFLDDKVGHPDKAKIAAWAEQIERHRLAGSDLLDGVQAFYDSPRERAIGVGDLIHHAKIVKRDRLDRQDESAWEVRRSTTDEKAADETRELAASAVFGPVTNPTERLKRAETALQTCTNKREAQDAMREFFDAKREALKLTPRRGKRGVAVNAEKGATA